MKVKWIITTVEGDRISVDAEPEFNVGWIKYRNDLADPWNYLEYTMIPVHQIAAIEKWAPRA
jgi:hypothetical protein